LGFGIVFVPFVLFSEPSAVCGDVTSISLSVGLRFARIVGCGDVVGASRSAPLPAMRPWISIDGSTACGNGARATSRVSLDVGIGGPAKSVSDGQFATTKQPADATTITLATRNAVLPDQVRRGHHGGGLEIRWSSLTETRPGTALVASTGGKPGIVCNWAARGKR